MTPRASVVLLVISLSAAPAAAPEPACDRGAFSRREARRHEVLLARLERAVVERRELPDGWAFRLPADAATLGDAAEWMTLERRCCAFFDFALEWKGSEPHAWLTVRGPEGAKAILDGAWNASGAR